jgi:prevent-host-death family protein
MRTITVTNARKNFGDLLKAVQKEPIRITRKNRDVDAVVVVSVEEYKRISGSKSFDAISPRLSRRTTNSWKSH